MKAILHLPIFINGKKHYTLHVTHMSMNRNFLTFRDYSNEHVLIIGGVSTKVIRFVDYTTSSVHEHGVSVK